MVNSTIFEKVKRTYVSNDVCMGDLMAEMTIGNYSLEDIFDTIIALKEWADGDKFYRLIGTDDFSVDNLEQIVPIKTSE
jgi:hypothetical protein